MSSLPDQTTAGSTPAPTPAPAPVPTPAPVPVPRPPRQRREPQPQRVLTVRRTERLSPHLIRVVAGGDDVASIPASDQTDRYAKMLFAPAGSTLVPPYDLAALRDELPFDELPSLRTYTVRRVDHAAAEIWVDFVVHGDSGVAGPWAARARAGDALVLAGIGGGFAPDSEADAIVLIGDESAIPAIAAALEGMDPAATGSALIEVDGHEDELDLVSPAGVDVRWIHRGPDAAGTSTVLLDAVRGLEWPAGDVQVFVHGEREAMKALRRLLVDERGVSRARLSLSAYWAYGRAEDAFQAEKREPIGQIFPE